MNAILAAAGCNFRLLINRILSWIITILLALLEWAIASQRSYAPKPKDA